MDDRLISVIFVVVAFFVSVGFFAWRKYSSHSKNPVFDVEDRRPLTKADGTAACLVCGISATKYMPVSGVSWMDKLPLLYRLYSLAPRYIIVDNVEGDICLCRLHHAVAVRKLEEFHAMLRAERARFNADQEERVASMDGGELFKAIMLQHQHHLKKLRVGTTPIPQIAMRATEEEIATAVVSGGASIPPDDEDD